MKHDSEKQARIDRARAHHGGKAARQARAAERQAEHDKLTPVQRYLALDSRLGVGVGAKRQRARLRKLFAAKEAS